MAFTPYQFFLVGLMLVTGTLNTLSTKWADIQRADFCHPPSSHPENETYKAPTFNHPFLQAVGMFIGEMFCLLAFKFIWYSTAKYRIAEMTYEGDASSAVVQCWPIKINKHIHLVDGKQTFNPLIFWIAAIFDMTSTCLGYFALNLTTASTFQMLRGSVIVFTAIFSLIFLKRKLTLLQWAGIGIVIVGLVVVGVSDLLSADTSSDDPKTTGQRVAGIVLVVLGMVFTGLQMVYEERYVGQHEIPPLQAVGWEGIFGFFTLGLLLIPFSFIHMAKSGTGPGDYLEDVPSAFCQMGHNRVIIVALIGNIFSIAFFNFAGISVTKELSATTRMVLDNGRTIIIWAVTLAIGWQTFHVLQIVGFLLLVIGMGTYNGVWLNLYRRYVKGEKGDAERQPIMASSNDAMISERFPDDDSTEKKSVN